MLGPGRLHGISDVDTAKMMDMDFAVVKRWDLGNPDPENRSVDTAETQIHGHAGRPRILLAGHCRTARLCYVTSTPELPAEHCQEEAEDGRLTAVPPDACGNVPTFPRSRRLMRSGVRVVVAAAAAMVEMRAAERMECCREAFAADILPAVVLEAICVMAGGHKEWIAHPARILQPTRALYKKMIVDLFLWFVPSVFLYISELYAIRKGGSQLQNSYRTFDLSPQPEELEHSTSTLHSGTRGLLWSIQSPSESCQVLELKVWDSRQGQPSQQDVRGVKWTPEQNDSHPLGPGSYLGIGMGNLWTYEKPGPVGMGMGVLLGWVLDCGFGLGTGLKKPQLHQEKGKTSGAVSQPRETPETRELCCEPSNSLSKIREVSSALPALNFQVLLVINTAVGMQNFVSIHSHLPLLFSLFASFCFSLAWIEENQTCELWYGKELAFKLSIMLLIQALFNLNNISLGIITVVWLKKKYNNRATIMLHRWSMSTLEHACVPIMVSWGLGETLAVLSKGVLVSRTRMSTESREGP
ncbi:hypothetical protein C8Q74DRAFT_1382529 [Fomes fomentarius]|nr:hypothetical protein C8Q74DRAFT_1382529 [Fomes fomentarius]